MKKRILAIAAVLAMLVTCFAGCKNVTPGGDTKDPTNTTNKPQLVVAMNPILIYDDNTSVVAFNDVNGAMKADNEKDSLTALGNDTAWSWVYATQTGWKQRAIYDMGKWQSGTGSTVKKTAAYSFNEDGDISLSRYTSSSLALTTYNGESVPDVGLLLSATGSEEEALCYTVTQDGLLGLPSGTITAIKEVAGVKTGFLAEDGTARSAALTIRLNNKQIWSGTLQNATAAEDGQAVTALEYPQLDSLEVTAGDKLFFTLKLEAQANKDEDVSKPELDESKFWSTVKKITKVPVDGNTSEGVADSDIVNADGSININANFKLVYTLVCDSANDTVVKMRRVMYEQLLNTNITGDADIAKPVDDEVKYEMIIGPCETRPRSEELYDELRSYRKDSGDDYLIKREGSKLYVIGANNIALQNAVNYLMANVLNAADAKIPANFKYLNRPAHDTYLLNGRNIGEYTIVMEKYPSYIATLAAEDLQTFAREKAGYNLDIVNITDAQVSSGYYNNKAIIEVGPLNGSIKMDVSDNPTAYATYRQDIVDSYTNGIVSDRIDTDGLIHGKGDGYYEVKATGGHLVLNGGTATAINAGAQAFIADYANRKSINDGYFLSGDYQSQIKLVDDYKNEVTTDNVKYTLSDGYGLIFNEEFDLVDDNHAETEAAIRKKWNISTNDTTCGPTQITSADQKLTERDGVTAVDPMNGDNGSKWDLQRRPGVYGDNWWVQEDAAGNGYLFEITKKEPYGYDAGRVIGQNTWGFRYGIWESRIVTGTRFGACSAIWSAGGAPGYKSTNEIDVYENFGGDYAKPNLHTWESAENGGHRDHNGSGDMERVTVRPAAGEHFYDTFHNFAIRWTADTFDFILDGKSYCYVDISGSIFDAMRTATTVKYANGVGTQKYSVGFDPFDYLVDAKNGINNGGTGFMTTVEQFYEVQLVDYCRLYQTSNENVKTRNQSLFLVRNGWGVR